MDGRVDVWVCGCVGVQMGVQPCGHADANGCKQKRKEKHLLGCFKRVDGRAEVDNCKEKERKKKNSLVWACGHVTDGRACTCGQTWMAVNKQTRKGERKKK